MKQFLIIKSLLLLIFSSLAVEATMAQSAVDMGSVDSLSVEEAIHRAITRYPSVQQAEEAVRSAEISAKITRSVYLPVISGKASYDYIAPISSLEMGGKTIHIQTHSNPSVGLSISQLIWDFGKSKPQIESSKLEMEIAGLQKWKIQQDLALQTIQSYYLAYYARHSIGVKERQMQDLATMVDQTRIKKDAGAATDFDYLNTSSNFNAIKTEIIAMQTAKDKNYITLALLVDTMINDNTRMSVALDSRPQTQTNINELINQAFEGRIEMKILHKQYQMALENQKSSGRVNNPTLEATASAGFRNGYEPSIDAFRFNYAIGAVLNVPIYDGSRNRREHAMGEVEVDKALSAIELAKKEIANQVADSYLSLVSSQSRIDQILIQQNIAHQAYQQAKVNYAANVITNLELLTSATNAINSDLQLLNEKINYQLAYYQLLVSIGVPIVDL